MKLTEATVEEALDYLQANADSAAKARAERIYMEEYRKSLKAQIMQRYAMLPLGAQEREAYADKGYLAHLAAMKTAIHEDEKHRFLLSAAEAKISAWQTRSANERAIKI